MKIGTSTGASDIFTKNLQSPEPLTVGAIFKYSRFCVRLEYVEDGQLHTKDYVFFPRSLKDLK